MPFALWNVESVHFTCRNQIRCPFAAKLVTQSYHPSYATAFRRKTRVANQGAVSCGSTFTSIWIVVTYSCTKYSVPTVACSSCRIIGQYVLWLAWPLASHASVLTCRRYFVEFLPAYSERSIPGRLYLNLGRAVLHLPASPIQHSFCTIYRNTFHISLQNSLG